MSNESRRRARIARQKSQKATAKVRPIQPKSSFLRSVFADAAIAAVISIVIGLIIGSLSTAGIINMMLALTLLALAWLLAIVGTFICGPVWEVSSKHRIIFGSILGVLFGAVGYGEYVLQPRETIGKNARFEFNGIELRPIAGSSDRLIGAQLINKGPVAGKGMNLAFSSVLTQERLNAPDQEKIMTDVIAQTVAFGVPKDEGNEVQPFELFNVGPPKGIITSDQLAKVISENLSIYLFVALNYRDDSLPKSSFMTTEVCVIFRGPLDRWQKCDGRHNRIYRHE
jgi:hypothetical protein